MDIIHRISRYVKQKQPACLGYRLEGDEEPHRQQQGFPKQVIGRQKMPTPPADQGDGGAGGAAPGSRALIRTPSSPRCRNSSTPPAPHHRDQVVPWGRVRATFRAAARWEDQQGVDRTQGPAQVMVDGHHPAMAAVKRKFALSSTPPGAPAVGHPPGGRRRASWVEGGDPQDHHTPGG